MLSDVLKIVIIISIIARNLSRVQKIVKKLTKNERAEAGSSQNDSVDMHSLTNDVLIAFDQGNQKCGSGKGSYSGSKNDYK